MVGGLMADGNGMRWMMEAVRILGSRHMGNSGL